MRKAIAWSFVPVVLAWSALASAASPRSLAAAESVLPADVELVAAANMKTLRTSQLYARAFGELVGAERDVREGLGKVKQSCGIDAEKVVDDLTVGIDRGEDGGIFVALSGVTEKQFLDCITKIAKEEAGEQLTAKKTGAVTELSTSKSTKKLYFAWLPGDVLVFASEPDDKALLDRVLGGKGEVKRTKAWQRLKAHDQESVLLAGWTKKIPGSGLDLKSGSLGLLYKAGKVRAETLLETGSKEDAEQIAAATKVVGSMLGLPKDAPKQLEAILKSIEAKTNGAEVKVSASAAEGDLLAILDWALRSQGLGSSKPAGRAPAPPTKPSRP
jgi:hypothetical protein